MIVSCWIVLFAKKIPNFIILLDTEINYITDKHTFGMIVMVVQLRTTVQCKFLTGKNIDEFDEFPAICQYFPYQIFHLVNYSMLMIGIRQFFTHQSFPNPDSSKFSAVKILHHTVTGIH